MLLETNQLRLFLAEGQFQVFDVAKVEDGSAVEVEEENGRTVQRSSPVLPLCSCQAPCKGEERVQGTGKRQAGDGHN